MISRLHSLALNIRQAVILWLPAIIVFLAVAFIAEASHAQATFALHYSHPTDYGTTDSDGLYSANGTPHGWRVFGIDARNDVVLRSFGRRGRLIESSVVDRNASYLSTPSMAWQQGDSLGAWIADTDQQTQPLKIAVFSRRGWKVRTVTKRGVAENPWVVPTTPGRFVLLFDWQRKLSQNFNVYAQRIDVGGSLLGSPVQLSKGNYYDYYPRGTWSHGHLFLVYLDVCCQDNAVQILADVRGKNFHLLGAPIHLGKMQLATTAPSQWGIDVKRGSGDRVLATWEANGIGLAEWQPSGRLVFNRTLAEVNSDLSNPALSLALLRHSGVVYYTLQGSTNTYVNATSFSYNGRFQGSQRVSFDQSSDDANPVASVVTGKPRVMWQSNGGDGAVVVEASDYEHRTNPSLLERVGLGVGNPYFDILILVIIGLAAGLPLTIINAGIPLGLILVWLAIGRFISSRLAWPLFIAVVLLTLALLFVIRNAANHWTFVIGGLGTPTAVAAVLGGVAVGAWLTSFGMRNEEPVYRAAVLVIAGLFIISSAWAVGQVEAHITML